MRNKELGDAEKRKAKDRMGRAYGEADEERREELVVGKYAGEGQEGIPDLPDATRRLKRQQGN